MLLYSWWTLNVFHICFLGDLTLDLGVMYIHSFSPPFSSCYHPSYSISFQCNLWNVSLVKHINMNPTHFHIFDTREVKQEQYYAEETMGETKPPQSFYNCESKSTNIWILVFFNRNVILWSFPHDLQMKFRLWCSNLTT